MSPPCDSSCFRGGWCLFDYMINQSFSEYFQIVDYFSIKTRVCIQLNLAIHPVRVNLKRPPSRTVIVKCSTLLLTAAYDKILWSVKFLNAITAGYSTLYV